MIELTFIALSLILENGVLNDGKTDDFLFYFFKLNNISSHSETAEVHRTILSGVNKPLKYQGMCRKALGR